VTERICINARFRAGFTALIPILFLSMVKCSFPAWAGPADEAGGIVAESGVKGGFIVHLGCGDGTLTAALRVNKRFLVQGLDADHVNVDRARKRLLSLGVCGPVSVDRLAGERLPYVNNMVNLLVAESLGGVTMDEAMRVLVPDGVAMIRNGGKWAKTVKPRPPEIDEWTHYLHDADGNPVARDSVVGPPSKLQWVGSPRWSRHHDRMASMSALVSAQGRVFYIMDEGSRASVILPSKWKLEARDAFNGTPLWTRDIPEWYFQLWPLKSGPTQLTRRLVAVGDRVYATLGLRAPTEILDAATGETIRTVENTLGTEEIICSQGTLFLLVCPEPIPDEPFQPDRSETWKDTQRAGKGWLWDEKPRRIMAVSAESGEPIWSHTSSVAPMTLCADELRVYFHDGDRVRALDRQSGKQIWESEPVSRRGTIARSFGPNLITYKGVLVFTGGDRKMTALKADTGAKLWTADHPHSGHASQEDLMIINGLVWSGDIANGKNTGVFKGLDLATGEVKKSFAPDVDAYWFHHRCYRSKATEKYLLPSRTGIEFVDYANESWNTNHWVRGGCVYGIMPCNGLVYAPPHSCACYLEAKLFGFNALASESAEDARLVMKSAAERLEKGPAYNDPKTEITPPYDPVRTWPNYRHDPGRSGFTAASIPAQLSPHWEAKLGGILSGVVIAEGKIFVASKDSHALYAIDAETGGIVWSFVAGGRIDSPPALYRGRAIFGSADGWVYCLRVSDGAMVWRFSAAPCERRLVAYEQVESVWPVSGSVLIQSDPNAGRDVLYCVAGRSMFLDGGLRMIRLDPVSGELLSEHVYDERDQETGKNLQSRVDVLNMPTALPDVLSSDGKFVYMRSQRFHLSGERVAEDLVMKEPVARASDQAGEDRHLFCPIGFLDDSWFHRSYWLYGRRYSQGCNWWANAGRYTPAGWILAYDEKSVYGYGRKPQYFQWTVPLACHMFGADNAPQMEGGPSAAASEIAVAKSDSLNPADKPLTVEAWINANGPDGVIIARGGVSHGYCLMLKKGKPEFLVRIAGSLMTVKSDKEVTGRWAHVAGELTADGKLKVFVDGKTDGIAESHGMIMADPADSMEIGWEKGSLVGEYAEAPRFIGIIDEIRVYHRTLPEDELAKHATGKPETLNRDGLALYFSFDAGDARDESGNGNHGGCGAKATEGKFGGGMEFDGGKASGSAGIPGIAKAFRPRWSLDFPIHVRAMVMAGDRLFVAGPPSTLDEEAAYRACHDPATMKELVKQDDAFSGLRGGMLIVLSKKDGTECARYKLDSPPAWDSMAAVENRICFTTMDGRVVCMGGRQ